MDCLKETLSLLERKLARRLHEKGWGALVSTHEVWGVVDEENNELKDAVHDNDVDAVREELLDIAVAALFGHASTVALENSPNYEIQVCPEKRSWVLEKNPQIVEI